MCKFDISQTSYKLAIILKWRVFTEKSCKAMCEVGNFILLKFENQCNLVDKDTGDLIAEHPYLEKLQNRPIQSMLPVCDNTYYVLETDLKCYLLDLETEIEQPVTLKLLDEADPDKFSRTLISFVDGVLLVQASEHILVYE